MTAPVRLHHGATPWADRAPGRGAVPSGTRNLASGTVRALAWQDRGACVRYGDPEFWQPVGDSGAARVQGEAAAAVCLAECPVLAECRAWALATRLEFGVAGGMTEGERRAELRRRARGRAAAGVSP